MRTPTIARNRQSIPWTNRTREIEQNIEETVERNRGKEKEKKRKNKREGSKKKTY